MDIERQESFKGHREGELPIFSKWFDFVKWFMPLTDKLPKKVRFSLTNRMSNITLDVVEDLVESTVFEK